MAFQTRRAVPTMRQLHSKEDMGSILAPFQYRTGRALPNNEFSLDSIQPLQFLLQRIDNYLFMLLTIDVNHRSNGTGFSSV